MRQDGVGLHGGKVHVRLVEADDDCLRAKAAEIRLARIGCDGRNDEVVARGLVAIAGDDLLGVQRRLRFDNAKARERAVFGDANDGAAPFA